jgi:molybdopterin/thiamine biosynthesis adenylyltransferase
MHIPTLTAVRPAFKPTLPIYRLAGTVMVQDSGEMTEIDDPDGWWAALTSLCDGTRTIAEVSEALAPSFPRTSPDDVAAALRELDEAGLLIDAAAPVPFDDHDRERWKRNLGFFELYSNLGLSQFELQRRVRDYRVAIFGCGGIGSHVAYDVVGAGVRDVRVVDFDRVELSNLNRQILYSEDDIGRDKAELVAARLKAYDHRVQVETHQRKLQGPEDVEELARGRDLVIAGVDRPKMRIARWVSEGCVRAGVPYISAGLDCRRAFHYTIIPGVSGCVRCWMRSTEGTVAPIIREERERTHSEGGVFEQDRAAFGVLVAVVTACVVCEMIRLATGIAPPVALGRVMEVRFDDGALREAERWERDPDCPVCGTAAVPERFLALSAATA